MRNISHILFVAAGVLTLGGFDGGSCSSSATDEATASDNSESNTPDELICPLGVCPPSACTTLPQSQCQSRFGCRWLIPGCGHEALPKAGCFAAKNCDEGSCRGDQHCEAVSVNPCPPLRGGIQCLACGAPASVCLPGPQEESCDFDDNCKGLNDCEGSSICRPDVVCVWQGEPGVCVPNSECTLNCRYGFKTNSAGHSYCECKTSPVCITVLPKPYRNPDTGVCVRFPTPCDVPTGWKPCAIK